MPIDKETGMIEPDITINGRPMTFQESMAIRVACQMMAIHLDDPVFRLGLGEELAANYLAHLGAIAEAMLTRPYTLQ